MKKRTLILIIAIAAAAALVALAVILFARSGGGAHESEEMEQDSVALLYGIDASPYYVEHGTIGSGETMGALFARYGVGASAVDAISRQADSVFSFRKIKAGNNYCAFMSKDSIPCLDYLVYEVDQTGFMVIDLGSDTTKIYLDQKDVKYNRVMKEAEITSSLWNAAVGNGMSPALAQELSEIYAWTIDFFAIQAGDKFGVIYDEKFVDSTMVGFGTIWGAWFQAGDKKHYAIPFIQDSGKVAYWDENGNSLRKNFLKAPLKYSRISSRFSNGRMHPILRIVRPHHGVDYAAPSGTPVFAIGDGVITLRGWTNGGGNTIKIRHTTGNLISSYMHLKGFGPGITNGKRVRQGELIGYVGSTGLSTGPHLDFRVYRGSTPIDPLKIPTEPAEPVKEANKPAFNSIRDRVMAELNGTLQADSLRVVSLDGGK